MWVSNLHARPPIPDVLGPLRNRADQVNRIDPDNYTDQGTFLENLQRNPRLKPYDFWPLVADSTVIVQHVCTVCIFVVCFVGIHQGRLSPVAVVGWGSIATSVGWFLWDWWVGKEGENEDIESLHRTRSIGPRHYRRASRPQEEKRNSVGGSGSGSGSGGQGEDGIAAPQTVSGAASSSASTLPSAESSTSNLLMPPGQALVPNTSAPNPLSARPYSTSASSLLSATSQASTSGTTTNQLRSRRTSSPTDPAGRQIKHRPSSPLRGGRAHLRMNTIKSAILIYFTLLGLSPILKSLTQSTSSDSIWAMSFWLLAINIFFFDYSGAWVGVNKFPVASLSTNAALMASTVLASRLPSTGQVFSLTLFSIEVFGLFPVFRRYARHRSWRYHVILTLLLVLGAGGGVGMILGAADCDAPRGCENQPWPWASGVLGMLVACVIAAVAMGGCSWWLIGLQKYKNEIYGPWDPARPIIISRRHWDDD
jgi:phosphatidylinositol N-acetylglucosaminyltransferase subunit C